MLDAVDARLDGSAYGVVAVGVGRHLESPTVGLVDNRPQLLVGVLLGTGWSGVGHDPARHADLDELGAVLHLVADSGAHLAHAVGDALLDRKRHDVRRQGLEHRRVEVPAGR